MYVQNQIPRTHKSKILWDILDIMEVHNVNYNKDNILEIRKKLNNIQNDTQQECYEFCPIDITCVNAILFITYKNKKNIYVSIQKGELK